MHAKNRPASALLATLRLAAGSGSRRTRQQRAPAVMPGVAPAITSFDTH